MNSLPIRGLLTAPRRVAFEFQSCPAQLPFRPGFRLPNGDGLRWLGLLFGVEKQRRSGRQANFAYLKCKRAIDEAWEA